MMKNFHEYEAAFEAERAIDYPAITRFEHGAGFTLERARLEYAARTLACPVKRNPPCWQHGRVIYAAVRRYLSARTDECTFLDIGTAKGFSALCMAFAAADAGVTVRITSVDVIDPNERVSRNSVADLSGLKTVREFVEGWPEASMIAFVQSTGAQWLKEHEERVHFAFVDGKHTFEAVTQEAKYLARRQQAGDVVIFDDLQIDGIAQAVHNLIGVYDVQHVIAKSARRYAVATRR